MRKSLFAKLVLTFIIIITCSFVILGAFLSIWFEGYYFDQRSVQLDNEAKIMEPIVEEYLDSKLSSEKMADTLTYISKYIYADIWIVDSSGYVYAVSDNKSNKLIGKKILGDELETIRGGKTVDKRWTFNSLFTLPVHSYIKPIYGPSVGFAGAVIMNTSLYDIKEPLKRVYYIIWVSATIAILSSSFVIYYFASWILIKPLGKINEASKKIAKGDTSKRVVVRSNDEIGELADSFNIMADSLEKVDKNRSDFISNVSHELRSPMTSINGFISGILDGVIPKEKERNYLMVTQNEVGRLNRLINDLLDLSAIESGNIKLNIQQVNIEEIIKETVIKFEQRIKDKEINIEISFQQENSLACCDKDRMEQVLTNLVDNAIKYGIIGGNIKIKTETFQGKLIVSIYNDCEELSADDLSHMFERFYKKDRSRTSKSSTGLGLSIARSILLLQDNEIWAEKRDKGIEFIFTLNK
ncbi:MAG: HAMP domain-containing sensor histidine kinase [Clostridiaceae bacterium]